MFLSACFRYFFSFGIGKSVNRYLIDGIAQAGEGESFVVTNTSESADTAKRFRTYIESPILTDIQINYNDFDVYDMYPDKLPTLFAQKPIVLFGKWRGEPSGTIEITGKTGTEDYVQKINVSNNQSLDGNEALPFLWARRKVEKLTDYGVNEENKDVKKEVTELGLNYSMITPYTSFIAVMNEIRNNEGESTDILQPLPLPSEVSEFAVGGGYSISSEPESSFLFFPILFIGIIGFLVRKKSQGKV